MNIKTPHLAVDVICYHPASGKIAIIERLNPPKGYALPGGFVDVGESVEDAARREMREEINVELKTLQLLGVYSQPERDPRMHVVSVAFVGIITEIPVAGDDAKSVQLILPDMYINPYHQEDCCFDHEQIVKDAMRRGMIPGNPNAW